MFSKFVIAIIIYLINGTDAISTANPFQPFESEVIPIESAPWQVSVRLKAIDLDFYGYGHICGGSVISQRVVLTAANCIVKAELLDNLHPENEYRIEYRNAEEFILVMGSESLSKTSAYTLQYEVQELIVHEAFNFTTLLNNVAMFFINDFIPWNWPTVRAVPLSIEPIADDVLCSTTGWNFTDHELRGTLVPIVDSSTCTRFYDELTSDLICAGYEEEFQHYFCDGDSGGPLVCLGHLTGIILEGNSCARTGYFGLYVNVLYHYNWIVATNKSFDYNEYVTTEYDYSENYPSQDYIHTKDQERDYRNYDNEADDVDNIALFGYELSSGSAKHLENFGILILYIIVIIYFK